MQVNGKVTGGLIWSGLERVLVQVVYFIQGVVLARLLLPEDFGLATMLGLFLGFGTILAESGMCPALIALGAGAADIEALERRAFRWNVCTALAVYAILMAISPLIAIFFRQPVLVPLMALMGLSMGVHACCVVANARLSREMRFGTLARINASSAIVGAAVGIAFATAGAGVWSIAALNLSWSLTRFTCLRLAICKRREVPGDCVVEFRDLVGYGWRLTLSGILHSAYFNSFNLVIGRLWNPAAVGLFTRGQRWAQIPGEVVNVSVGNVAFARMSQSANTSVAHWFLMLNASVLWTGLFILGVWAPEIVGMVLGESWLDCVPYLRILVIGAAFTPISNIAQAVVKVRGEADRLLKGDAVKLPLAFLFLALGCGYGIEGICWAKAAGDALDALVDAYLAWGPRRDDLKDCMARVLGWISLLMVVNVAWLHAAAGLGVQESAPAWMRGVWGVSVPYFFVVSMWWMAARWQGLVATVKKRVRSLLVPYFLWCWLGAVWSIALHGVQLRGWDALRYLGLQPGWDPAYQPMWFLKALFVVLLGEAFVIWAWRSVAQRLGASTDEAAKSSPGKAPAILAYVFPLYVLHSLFLSVFKYFGIMDSALGRAVLACLGSAVAAWVLRRVLPRVASVLFGGR